MTLIITVTFVISFVIFVNPRVTAVLLGWVGFSHMRNIIIVWEKVKVAQFIHGIVQQTH